MYKGKSKNKRGLVSQIKGVAALIIIIGLIIGSYYIVVHPDSDKQTFAESLKKLNDFANSYYSDGFPEMETGSSKKIKLSEIQIADKLFSTEEKCSLEESYIQVTKLDNEYQLKSYLSCKDKNDFVTSYVSTKDKEETTTATTTTTTTTTKKITMTTKKKTTAAKKVTYKVSFNTNGGDIIDDIIVEKGKTIKEIVPVRKGYKFIGWYYKDEKYDMKKPINEDIVLLAKWTLE